MSELPCGWASATLTELIDPEGIFTDGDWVETKDQDPSGGVRLTQLADVGDGVFRDRSSRFLRADQAANLNCTFLEAGDVLIARMPDPLGRACVLPPLQQPAVTAVDVCVVRPGAMSVDSRWLMWAINSPRFRARVAALQTGTTRKRISRKNLASIPLPVPPLAEQRRIVAAIEEQFSRLDACGQSLVRAVNLLAALRESAIESALSEEWPAISVGEVGDGSRNALAIGPFGSNLKVSDYTDSGVPLIFVRNIRSRRFDPLGARFVSDAKAHELAAHSVRPGDVLITKMGEPPGDTAVYPLDASPAILTADCIKISPSPDFDSTFLAFAIAAKSARVQVIAITKGVAQKKVSLTRFKTVLVPAPPLDEQRRIVAELEQQLSLIDSLRTAVASAQKRGAALRRAILERAFRGELVPQDPDDEPASVLLERIRAERAAAPRPSRRRATMEAS